jgi:hypothetical protein
VTLHIRSEIIVGGAAAALDRKQSKGRCFVTGEAEKKESRVTSPSWSRGSLRLIVSIRH